MKNLLLVAAAVALCVSANAAGLITGFEPPEYSGSAAGTSLTGQQGWYVPSGTNYYVYTHADNVLGFAPHPGGDLQFIAGKSLGGTDYARAEKIFDWKQQDVWTVSFDVAAQYLGTLPAQDYLGSFSLQPSTSAMYWQTLNIWNSLDAPTTFRSQYVTLEFAAPGISPGPAWDNLQANHWYRQSTTFKFSTKEITEVAITDLTTGVTTTVNPVGWHLADTTGGGVMPTALRFFSGGGTGGNTVAWDNLVVPEPASLLALVVGLLACRRR
jgi:hypothetical protein